MHSFHINYATYVLVDLQVLDHLLLLLHQEDLLGVAQLCLAIWELLQGTSHLHLHRHLHLLRHLHHHFPLLEQ